MKKLVLLCAMMLLMSANSVRAQNVLWVSATGSDGNACSTSAPCATFQGAINKGIVSQINCINSGSYGAFTITTSITVDCGTGNVGHVVVNAGVGIAQNTASSANVVLRHLSLNGISGGSDGIGTT